MWENEIICPHCKITFKLPYLWCPLCQTYLSNNPIQGPPVANIKLTSMWSFKEFLPPIQKKITLIEGATPCVSLQNYFSLKGLNVKLEFRNPTGSFRDRAASLIVSDASNHKINQIIGASTGSFGISIAAYCAQAKLKCLSVIPEKIDLSKLEQLRIYGSRVIRSGRILSETIDYAQKLAAKELGNYPIPIHNLLMIEGQKTIGLELVKQLGEISAIIVPRGSGSLILSIFRGFQDAIASGWIENMPKFYPVALKPTEISYLAESLEIGDARLIERVDQIVTETKGQEFIIESKDMLTDAQELAKNEGFFVEPSSASVLSAAKKLMQENQIDLKSSVAILSGSGLNALNIFASQMRDIKKSVWGLSSKSTIIFEILNLIVDKKATLAHDIWNAIVQMEKQPLKKQRSIKSIYQHLSSLEQRGFIESNLIDKKTKKYSATSKGLLALDSMREFIDYI